LIAGLYETDHVKDLDADTMQELLIHGQRDHVSSREFEFSVTFRVVSHMSRSADVRRGGFNQYGL
jgi:hypothetical protein